MHQFVAGADPAGARAPVAQSWAIAPTEHAAGRRTLMSTGVLSARRRIAPLLARRLSRTPCWRVGAAKKARPACASTRICTSTPNIRARRAGISISSTSPVGRAARASAWWRPATSPIRPGRAELKEKLVPAEPGLFRLRDDIEQASRRRRCRAACRAPVRFMLEVEISTIYKKGDRTRKIHHLIYAPDFETVDRIVGAARPHRQHRVRRTADPRARLPAISSRSRSSPVRTPISCRRISGRRGSRRSGRSRASTPSRNAMAISPITFSRWRPGSRPIRR